MTTKAFVTNTTLLTSKRWSIIKVEESVSGGEFVDKSSTAIENCAKDDTENYASGFNYSLSVGSVKCSDHDVAGTGTWAWKNDEKKLVVTIEGDDTYEYTVESLTDGKMVILYDYTELEITTTSRFTYTGK